jgi:tRNA threonylcarbamoyladenosine biosynthesis protein TsaE
MLQLRAATVDDTHAIAAVVASVARSGDVIVLAGDMGAGKTAFAQGFGAAIGVAEPMTSPTYNLVHSHPAGKLTIHHADLYRLSTQHEVADLAFAELVEADGVLLVEWGDVVAGSLGDHLVVTLVAPGVDGGDTIGAATVDTVRSITLRGVGRGWANRWDTIAAKLAGFGC